MKFHDVDQNTEEWMALRLGKVTSSKYSVIMAHEGSAFGKPAHDYALSLALQRFTGKRPRDETFTNEHMERGHKEEPLARMEYENRRFVDVRNGGFFDWGTHGTSPDGLVDDDGIIEIKSVIKTVHYATLMRGTFDPAYRWQLIGHLEGTGRQWVDFISYCPDYPEHHQLLIYRVNRDDVQEEIQRLRHRRDEFEGLIQSIMDNLREQV